MVDGGLGSGIRRPYEPRQGTGRPDSNIVNAIQGQCPERGVHGRAGHRVMGPPEDVVPPTAPFGLGNGSESGGASSLRWWGRPGWQREKRGVELPVDPIGRTS